MTGIRALGDWKLARGHGVILAAFGVVFLGCGGCAATGGGAAQSGQVEEQVIFAGMVERVEILGRREAKVYPVGVDPHFLLMVKVTSVQQNRSSPVAAGQTLNFAIHSPSRLLGTDAATKDFQFVATWKSGPEKRFSWIEAVRVTASSGKAR